MTTALLALLFFVADLMIFRQFVDRYGPLSFIVLLAIAFYIASWLLNRVDWRRMRMVRVVVEDSGALKHRPEWLRPSNPNPLISFFSTNPPVTMSSTLRSAKQIVDSDTLTANTDAASNLVQTKEPQGLRGGAGKIQNSLSRNRRMILIFWLLAGLLYIYYTDYVAFNNLVATAISAATMGLMVLFYISMAIVQFVAIFWFMAKSRMTVILPGDPKTIDFDQYIGQPKLVVYGRNLASQVTNHEEFRKVGGRIPSGALLHGLPGGGKTYFAKCLAGECNKLSRNLPRGIRQGVAFVGIEGSSFRGMFWGVDTLKVMEFFGKLRSLARKYGAPSIGYIDEIDSVGMSRGGVAGQGGTAGLGGGGMFGGTSGALTRILYEIDSLEETGWKERFQRRWKEALGLPDMTPFVKFFILGATNRPDVLDPALVRSGRLEQKILIEPPDRSGRRQIIKYYLGTVNTDNTIDEDAIEAIVHDTQGDTPADLMSAIKTGAVQIAVGDGRGSIGFLDVDRALERKKFGLEQPIEEMEPEQLKAIAIHEAGHTVISHHAMPKYRLVRLTIIRHGDALGYLYRPRETEGYSQSLEESVEAIKVSYAGHIAAGIYHGELWTGAAGGDFTHVHHTLLRLVMSAYFGPPLPEGTTIANILNIKRIIRFIEEQAKETEDLLIAHWPEVIALTDLLLEKERLTNKEILSVLEKNSAGRGERAPSPEDEAIRAEARKNLDKLRAEAKERQKDPWTTEIATTAKEKADV